MCSTNLDLEVFPRLCAIAHVRSNIDRQIYRYCPKISEVLSRMSVRSYSPSLSMPSTPTHHRKLSSSSRRGSTSAPDPWALHALSTPASSTSRLHIVRLPPPTKEEIERYEKEHGTGARRASWGSSGITKSMSAERISFASAGLPRAGSIDIPRPRIHPSSTTGFLAPQQLYDLAMSSIHPQVSAEEGSEPTPAVFTPLPATHYLPFIVRPNEVHQLLSQGPPRRLWALIKQIYPKNLVEESDDPTKWPFSQLERWMFKVNRHEASDQVWVYKARTCISRRSETLWEKLKNALGVPPELEVDDEFSTDEEMEAVVGSAAGLNLAGKSTESTVDDGDSPEKKAGEETVNQEGPVNEDPEIAEMGPTGLVLEAIYPSAASVSPPTHKSSPSKRDIDGFASGMDVIGEEEEDEGEKLTISSVPKPKTDDLETNQENVSATEKQPDELDPSRMVGLTFVSHSKCVPLQQFMGREESGGDAIVDSPLFPSNFAGLTSPTALSRYVPTFTLKSCLT